MVTLWLTDHYLSAYTPGQVMQDLLKITAYRPRFAVTSNVEGHFAKAGFKRSEMFEIEGSAACLRCTKNCSHELYPSEEIATRLAPKVKNGELVAEYLPRCPHCGALLIPNTCLNPGFAGDLAGQEHFEAFLKHYSASKLVILELGIGWRNQMIKAPLMELVKSLPQTRYLTLNKSEIFI